MQLTLRTDWSELDYFKHVNNVSFFKYIQSARVHFWDETGISRYHLENNLGPMLASCTCDFKAPLFYPGNVHIQTTVNHIGNSSFGFTHRLYNEAGILCAEAKDVMVMYDFNKEEKISIPAQFRLALESYKS